MLSHMNSAVATSNMVSSKATLDFKKSGWLLWFEELHVVCFYLGNIDFTCLTEFSLNVLFTFVFSLYLVINFCLT